MPICIEALADVFQPASNISTNHAGADGHLPRDIVYGHIVHAMKQECLPALGRQLRHGGVEHRHRLFTIDLPLGGQFENSEVHVCHRGNMSPAAALSKPVDRQI